MSELVRHKKNVIDVSYVEHTSDRKVVYEVSRSSKCGGALHDYANPISQLDARNVPGYRNKNSIPVHEPKIIDYAEPMSILRKERPIKKINALSVILLILITITALFLIFAPSKVSGAIFGLSLMGFVIHQLLHKEVAVDPKVMY